MSGEKGYLVPEPMNGSNYVNLRNDLGVLLLSLSVLNGALNTLSVLLTVLISSQKLSALGGAVLERISWLG